MARPIDESLEYFPLDVDFYDDPKILLIEEQFGIKGGYIANRLLCWIYRNGYYTNWNEEIALVFAKRVGNGITHALVNEIVNALLKRSFFNKSLFERCGILTSKGIQKRWVKIMLDSKRKARLKDEFDLINTEETPISSEETIGETELTTAETELMQQRKGKESKVKESSCLSDPFFQMFRRVSGNHLTDNDLMIEIAKFKNKYPNAHPNKSGALINAWVANIGNDKIFDRRNINSFI